MNKKITIGILVLIVLALGVYVYVTQTKVSPAETPITATSTGKLVAHDISWKITETETNAEGTPHAEISVTIDGVEHVVGTFPGLCRDTLVSGTIDGTGLVEGELAAVQCYWAGFGDEIGVFANGTGTLIKVGELQEPSEDTPAFRGNFTAI